jgi:hypothetical protein
MNKDTQKYLVYSGITILLYLLYRWEYLKIVPVGNSRYRVMYKTGLLFGSHTFDFADDNYSSITLWGGYQLVPVQFGDNLSVQMVDGKGITLQQVKVPQPTGNLMVVNNRIKV